MTPPWLLSWMTAPSICSSIRKGLLKKFVGPDRQCLLPGCVAKIFEEKICAGVESVSVPSSSDVAV